MNWRIFFYRLRILDPDRTVSFTSLLFYFAIVISAVHSDSLFSFGVLALAVFHANLKRLAANSADRRIFELNVQKARERSEYEEDLKKIEERFQELEAEQKKLAHISNISRLGR